MQLELLTQAIRTWSKTSTFCTRFMRRLLEVYYSVLSRGERHGKQARETTIEPDDRRRCGNRLLLSPGGSAADHLLPDRVRCSGVCWYQIDVCPSRSRARGRRRRSVLEGATDPSQIFSACSSKQHLHRQRSALSCLWSNSQRPEHKMLVMESLLHAADVLESWEWGSTAIYREETCM